MGTTLDGGIWDVVWWDRSQTERVKGVEDLCPFEEADWWYRINQKTWSKRCVHFQNTDGTLIWTMEDEGGMDTDGLEQGAGQREVQGVSVTGSGV